MLESAFEYESESANFGKNYIPRKYISDNIKLLNCAFANDSYHQLEPSLDISQIIKRNNNNNNNNDHHFQECIDSERLLYTCQKTSVKWNLKIGAGAKMKNFLKIKKAFEKSRHLEYSFGDVMEETVNLTRLKEELKKCSVDSNNNKIVKLLKSEGKYNKLTFVSGIIKTKGKASVELSTREKFSPIGAEASVKNISANLIVKLEKCVDEKKTLPPGTVLAYRLHQIKLDKNNNLTIDSVAFKESGFFGEFFGGIKSFFCGIYNAMKKIFMFLEKEKENVTKVIVKTMNVTIINFQSLPIAAF